MFHQFVASDDASEKFANLKRLHGLMPYFMMKTALKISNPVSMIRSEYCATMHRTSAHREQVSWTCFWLSLSVAAVSCKGKEIGSVGVKRR